MEKTRKHTLLLSALLILGAAILRWPDFFGVCMQVGTMDGGSGCYLDVYNELGIPAFAFAEILIVAAVLWFMSEATRRRWNRFGFIYIIISAAILLLVSPDLRGFLGTMPIRSEVAAWLSLLFGVISALIILISEIFARRRSKQVLPKPL